TSWGASSRSRYTYEPVEPRAVRRRHLLDERRIEPREGAGDRLARVRERAVRMRVIRRPHEVARAKQRQQLGAERLLLERRVDLAAEDLARSRLEPVVFRLGNVLLRGRIHAM